MDEPMTSPLSLALAGALLASPLALLAHPDDRDVWTAPGTSGAIFNAGLWDKTSNRIIATCGNEVLSIDPVMGGSKVVTEILWDKGHPSLGKGPRLDALAVGPGGVITFSAGSASAGGEIPLLRHMGDGSARPITGLLEEKDSQGAGTEVPVGDILRTRDLAAGPDGELYVADSQYGRVFLLSPCPAAGAGADASDPNPDLPPAPPTRFTIRAIAGRGRNLDLRGADLTAAMTLEHKDARQALICPAGIALAPGGELVVADKDGNRIHLLSPRTGTDGLRVWDCTPVAGTGEADFNGEAHGDARSTCLDGPTRVAAGDDGLIYALAGTRVWAFTPTFTAEGRRWSSQLIAGSDPEGSWAEDGKPALGTSFSENSRLAPVPGGGLLVTDGRNGIRYIGPARGDGALALRIEAHREAKDWDQASQILGALLKCRDSRQSAMDLPFQPLGKDAFLEACGTRPGLPLELRQLIGSFLRYPEVDTFRAAMAVNAIRAGSLRERLLLRLDGEPPKARRRTGLASATAARGAETKALPAGTEE
jgi:hypothetical protein